MRRLGVAPKLDDFKRDVRGIEDWFQTVTGRLNIYEGTSDPVAAEIPKGQWIIYRNSTSGEIRIWANYDGVLVSTAAFT